MIRPQPLAIFRELESFSTCAAYVSTYGGGDFKIKILKSLKSDYG